MIQDAFCGSQIGNLIVLGIVGKVGTNKQYAVKCIQCATDPELNGDAIYKSTKSKLELGVLPCSCSVRPKWTTYQYRILVGRSSRGRYTFTIPDGTKALDKIECKCTEPSCGHKWSTSVSSLMTAATGCLKCVDRSKIASMMMPEKDAISKIEAICRDSELQFGGFDPQWHGHATLLRLTCQHDHYWTPTFNNFTNHSSRCPSCAQSGYNRNRRGFFYVYLWTNGTSSFIKYGITNHPSKRANQQGKKTKYVPIQLFVQGYDDGSIPMAIERAVDQYKRTNNIGPQVIQSDFPDGYTETIPVNEYGAVIDAIIEVSFLNQLTTTSPIVFGPTLLDR